MFGRYILVFWYLFWAIPQSALATESVPATMQWTGWKSDNTPVLYPGYIEDQRTAFDTSCQAIAEKNGPAHSHVGYSPNPTIRTTLVNGTSYRDTATCLLKRTDLPAYPNGYFYNADVWVANKQTMSCPDNTWTLEGTVCKRVVCPDDQVKVDGQCYPRCKGYLQSFNASNECVCNINSVSVKNQVGTSRQGEGSIPATFCLAGCEYKVGEAIGFGGKSWSGDLSSPTGQTCSDADDKPSPPKPPTKKPPCAPGEGVGTSSSGNVLCVPEGTPNAPTPDVTKTKKSETFPDGSTKETETTKTRDPSTGAEHVSSSSTSSGGMAGAEGTTSSDESSSGNSGNGKGEGDGDGDGDCDPTLHFCGGPEVGDLWEGKGKTFGDAINKFKGAVSESAIGRVGNQWFQVSVPSGGCPNWTASVPYLDITLSASEYFCNSSIQSALFGAGWVVLFLASFVAFRWAFL